MIFANRKYTLRRCGYYGRTNGGRHYLHRDVWEAANGPIPRGYDIHHKDENPANNRIDNLALLPKADHTKLHHRQKRGR